MRLIQKLQKCKHFVVACETLDSSELFFQVLTVKVISVLFDQSIVRRYSADVGKHFSTSASYDETSGEAALAVNSSHRLVEGWQVDPVRGVLEPRYIQDQTSVFHSMVACYRTEMPGSRLAHSNIQTFLRSSVIVHDEIAP